MDYSVTVGAYRSHVCNWVDFIFFTNVCEGRKMMDMDKACCVGAVSFSKIETANVAERSMMFYALTASPGTTFVGIDRDCSH